MAKREMKNKLLLTAISFLANFIMAGYASQFGMLIKPIATEYQADINQVASIFSLLNGGALAGTIVAFFLIERLGIKFLTVTCYSLVAAGSLAMYVAPNLWIVMAAMSLIGFCGGIGLCIAGTIVVSLWTERVQSSMLVVQDATFNIAGVVFPLITIYALTHSLSWSSSYLAVGCVALLTVFIALFVVIPPSLTGQSAAEDVQKSEWNFGIISSGIGLLMGMLALYTFLTWAPIFVESKFNIPEEEAGNIITQYWSAALIGALVSTLIVTQIRINYFLMIIISLALVMTTLIVTTNDLGKLPYYTYGYGFVCAALYNSFIAFGVSFVKQASSKNVSFILISGSSGAMFSPAISAILEKNIGLQKVMYAIPAIYLIIIVMLVLSFKLHRRA